MDDRNLAYDLSFYTDEAERHVARKEKKQSVLINAQTKFSLGRKILNVVSIAAMFALVIGVIATNAAITTYTTKIANEETQITRLESEKSYLEFTLESRMTLSEIEDYAVNTLGMVKMDSAQKKYVELESENAIVVSESAVKERIDEVVQPILSYLLP